MKRDEDNARLKVIWDQPCQFIAFPLRKRIGKVRRVAEVYDSKRGNDRKSYWNRTVDTLGDQLDALGYDEAAINRELQTFTQAVKAELDRMRGAPPTSQNPDGAA